MPFAAAGGREVGGGVWDSHNEPPWLCGLSPAPLDAGVILNVFVIFDPQKGHLSTA